MSQLIDLHAYLIGIDGAGVSFNLSAWLGGCGSGHDYGQVSLQFLNEVYQAVGNRTTSEPIDSADRAHSTGLVFRQYFGLIPQSSRYAAITVNMVRVGGGDNDASADNIALTLQPVPS